MVPSLHHVLLVEDDLDHRFLAMRALGKVVNDPSSIHVASTGNEAISYLAGERQYQRMQHPFPSIVITDLKMHDGDGFDVLEFLGTNSAWCIVPRIVLTTSDSDDDISLAYELGASAYHLKPATLHETEQQMAQIIAYWSTNHVPCSNAAGRMKRAAPGCHRNLPAETRHRVDRPARHLRPAARVAAKFSNSS